MAKGKRNIKAHRSAKTGKFVTEKYAKKHPNTTVKETIRRTSKRKLRDGGPLPPDPK